LLSLLLCMSFCSLGLASTEQPSQGNDVSQPPPRVEIPLSQADELYNLAIETLESIQVRKPSQTSSESTSKRETPLVYRLARSGLRVILDRLGLFSSFNIPKQSKTPSSSDSSKGKEMRERIPDSEIPKISYSDSKDVKRAKAIRLLELASTHDHAPSLMTLGDMHLVN
jgi:hypothetical protein